MQKLSRSLAENLAALDALFGASADYYAKEITIYHCKGAIILFDGMASLDSLWELLLDAASRQAPPNRSDAQPLTGQEAYALILHGSAFPAESSPVQDMPDLLVVVKLRSRQRGNRGRTAVRNALLQQRFGPPAFRFKLSDRLSDLVMAFILSHAKTAEDPAVLTFYLMELSCKDPIVFTQDP